MPHTIPSSSPPPCPSSSPAVFAGEGLLCVRGERAVFANLSFRVEAGDALLLVGPNGSGKSSLLRLMALLLHPASGRLTWDDRSVADDSEAHAARTRYVGHLDAIKPVLALRENVAFWARLAGAGTTHVDAALEAFNLTRLAQVPGRLLSAGQKRRANLARLVAAPAPLWLLDEPTTALDRASIALLEDRLARHRAEGGMVVLSTHQDIVLPGARVLALDRFAPGLARPASARPLLEPAS
ncbi:heme ABC exporter ATP-binding protein CcmA [Pararhodospirillum oryzae]|uniref:Cytochrome c biogenesis ATP-binding export protein CcmA n=1 Tax=Pararhodospirillum oryzae TaxID=478448 RepID=A0A512H6F0_9PROT|nr:heme ABC exporter ATP-binding protein CcmA [Pararhodospirillum oryzae]GEO81039.1 cytochrome c biogenesis ATP-binding export protein CcmA [Pararhodospirillum oryzae]